MNTSKTARALAALGAALLVAATGCSGGSSPNAVATTLPKADRDQLITAAKAEGELTWYSTEAVAVNDAAIAGFEAKYGIKVTVLRLASTDLLPRYAAERQAGQATADVFTYGSPEPFVQNKDWFVKLGPDVVPGLADYPTGPGGWEDTNVLLNVTPNVIAYNTNLVKDPPTSWKDVIDPKYKNNVVLTSPNGGRTYMGWANVVSQRHGKEFLQSLAAQDLKVAPTGGPGAQQVAAGGAAISVPNATTLVEPLIKQGAPIKYVIPSDPPTGSDLRANITSNAKHPNAARLFLDYRTSQEAQEVVCKAALNAVASPRSDAASCIKLSPEFKFIDYFALTPDVESQILDALGLPAR